jgi:hypothetical protein
MDKEKRAFKIETRKVDDGSVTLVGMPIVYGKASEDIGFIEYVDAGAAKKALERSDIRALYGHNSDSLLPLGRQSSKTLRAKETDKGVTIEIDPPKRNTFVDALLESIERGDIREMSFGFSVAEDDWIYPKRDDEPIIRHIIELREIYDVSFVTFAAYPDTTVALRKIEEHKNASLTGGDEGDGLLMDFEAIAEEDELYRKINKIAEGGNK